MRLPSEAHLTYCTNVHPGERAGDVLETVRRWVPAVKDRVSPGEPFGVGLRVSEVAARELTDPERPDQLAELRDLLKRNDLYAFTLNGFPYGSFHDARVKESVYAPDWRAAARLEYTNRLSRLLAELLPDGVEGSISTVPIGFRPDIATPETRAQAAAMLVRHAAVLHELRERTGKTIRLALEPEPCCALETTAEGVAFLEDEVFSKESIEKNAGSLGGSGPGEDILRRHLGLCLDACHAAVEFEDPTESVRAIEAAGISVPKVQVTTGLELRADATARAALGAFADDVYLHQVVERRLDGRLVRHLDLADALSSPVDPSATWRVHFHVPVFARQVGAFGNTQDHLAALLALVRARGLTRHYEIETYTWEMIPTADRPGTLVDALAREIEWTRARL